MTPESRILYFREITDRTHRAAPFLEFDDDPYMVVADGKLWWIQDAFTTTNRFPYSQRTGEAFNYIRNSVKVVVDAYNGDVTYYVIEPDDAIIQTYSKIFPSLFKPFEEMPAELQPHIRYPEELFNVQEFMFRTYHLTDARAIFTKEDLWDRPSEIFYDNPQPMEAYYVSMPLPGEVEAEFLLLLPFTPLNKPNMIAWLAARNDGENYGKLVAFTFPKDQQVDGPQQVEARINNDPRISQQFTLWGQQGSQIIRGNLLVIPLEESLIFVEPVYLQASTLNFPELKRVVVAIDDKRPVMEPTLERALLRGVRARAADTHRRQYRLDPGAGAGPRANTDPEAGHGGRGGLEQDHRGHRAAARRLAPPAGRPELGDGASRVTNGSETPRRTAGAPDPGRRPRARCHRAEGG